MFFASWWMLTTWNCFVSYDDIPVGDLKVDSKSSFADFLSKVKKICHSCERHVNVLVMNRKNLVCCILNLIRLKGVCCKYSEFLITHSAQDYFNIGGQNVTSIFPPPISDVLGNNVVQLWELLDHILFLIRHTVKFRYHLLLCVCIHACLHARTHRSLPHRKYR